MRARTHRSTCHAIAHYAAHAQARHTMNKGYFYIVMAYLVMTYVVVAYTVMAYIVVAYVVMACIVMAYIVMT